MRYSVARKSIEAKMHLEELQKQLRQQIRSDRLHSPSHFTDISGVRALNLSNLDE